MNNVIELPEGRHRKALVETAVSQTAGPQRMGGAELRKQASVVKPDGVGARTVQPSSAPFLTPGVTADEIALYKPTAEEQMRDLTVEALGTMVALGIIVALGFIVWNAHSISQWLYAHAQAIRSFLGI